MAGCAFELSTNDVTPMRKVDVAGLSKQRLPLDRFINGQKLDQAQLFLAVGKRLFVAVQADRIGRQARSTCFQHAGMTVHALQTLLSVQQMVEGNGLDNLLTRHHRPDEQAQSQSQQESGSESDSELGDTRFGRGRLTRPWRSARRTFRYHRSPQRAQARQLIQTRIPYSRQGRDASFPSRRS